jgi:hypothetical protein
MMYLAIFIHLFLIQGMELRNESYIGDQVEHVDIQSGSLSHEETGSSFVASGVDHELLSKVG